MGFVLGLNGAAGAGKDTVADYLIDNHGWTKKLSFAANLKKMCMSIFFLTEADVNEQEAKGRLFQRPKVFTDRNLGSVMFWMSLTHRDSRITKDKMLKVKSLVGTELETPRRVLQFIGTDICRTLIPTYHVDCLVKNIEEDPNGLFIITDARFPNEGDLIIEELGGAVALIKRPKESSALNIDRAHPSETAMLKWGKFVDVINNNREGLPFLYEEIESFLQRNELCQETTAIQLNADAAESSFPMEGIAVPRSTGTTLPTP